MKLRAPKGCTNVSHGGRVLNVGDDGSLDCDDDMAEGLAAHGFRPWLEGVDASPTSDGRPEIDVGTLSRRALFALLRKKGVRIMQPISTADLRAAARRALASQ